MSAPPPPPHLQLPSTISSSQNPPPHQQLPPHLQRSSSGNTHNVPAATQPPHLAALSAKNAQQGANTTATTSLKSKSSATISQQNIHPHQKPPHQKSPPQHTIPQQQKSLASDLFGAAFSLPGTLSSLDASRNNAATGNATNPAQPPHLAKQQAVNGKAAAAPGTSVLPPHLKAAATAPPSQNQNTRNTAPPTTSAAPPPQSATTPASTTTVKDPTVTIFPTSIHTIINVTVDIQHQLLAGCVDLFLKNTTAVDITDVQIHVSDQMRINGAYEVLNEEREISDDATDLSTAKFQSVIHNKSTTRENTAYANAESSESSEIERSLLWALEIRAKQAAVSDAGALLVKLNRPWKRHDRLRIRIYYEIVRPTAGLYFMDAPLAEDQQDLSNGTSTSQQISSESKKKLTGYAYTCGRSSGARLWFPCIDAPEAFSSYEIEITTHKDAIVVCTGTLVDQYDNQEMGIRTAKFIHDEHPISPHLIAFAIGPFGVYIDEELPYITHFFPKKYPVHHIKHTVLYLRKVVAYFSSLTKLPFHELYPSFKIVFLDSPIAPLSSFCTLGIVSTDYILDPAVIDGTVQRRIDFSSLISSQYFGNFILPKYFSDTWLTVGIARFMSLLYLERAYGPDELRYYLLEQCEEMPKKDDSTMALGDVRNFPQTLHPILQHKSPLVCYMINQIIGRSNMEAIIENLVSEALGPFARSQGEDGDGDVRMRDIGKRNGAGEKSTVYAYTDSFLKRMEDKIAHAFSKRLLYTKTIRTLMTVTYRIPKQDVRDFFAYWVNGRGFPQFQCAYTYDPNRSKILFAFKQVYSVDSESSTYAGKIKLEIHEKDYNYSREVRVDSTYFWVELDCTSKPRKNQKKADTEDVQYEIPIKYIIVNPELTVLCHVNLWQDVSQWMYQLEGTKDLIGQLTAVRGLKYWQSPVMLSVLRPMLHSNDVFYRIRYAIVDIFAEDTHPELTDSVLTLLRDYFMQKYCDMSNATPLPNDFSSIIEYTMKKKLIHAFGLLRDRNGVTPNAVLPLLRSLLQQNDNSRNKFSDTHYLATLLTALTNTNPPTSNIDEVERWNKKYLVLDSLIPSHHSHFSVVTLKNLTQLFCTEQLPLDVSLFEDRLRPELPIQVRETALSCLAQIHDTAFEKPYKLQFDHIFLKIVNQIIDGDDLPYHKHRMCRALIDGINRCSARLVEGAIREETSQNTSLELFLQRVRSPSVQNRPLVEKLWKQTLNHQDPQQQADMISLYLCLWGTQAPSCYQRKPLNFVHTVRIDKYHAIFYDPKHPVIEFKEPEYSVTSETSVGFKVTKMTIKEGPNAPPFLGAHAAHITPELPPQSMEEHQKSDLPTPKINLLMSTFPKDDKKRKRKESSSNDQSPDKKKKRSNRKKTPPLQMIPQGDASSMPPPSKKPSKKAPTSASTSSTPPNPLVGELLGALAYPTPLPFSLQDKVRISSAVPAIDRMIQELNPIPMQPEATIPNYQFFVEIVLRSGVNPRSPPIIIPIRLKETASTKILFQMLPVAHNQIRSDIDGMVYSTIPNLGPNMITYAPEFANEPRKDIVRKGDIPYWPEGQSVIIPFAKTQLTTNSEYNHRKIKLYGQCLILGSSYIRLPQCKSAETIQIMRGRKFGVLFRDTDTQQEVCRLEAALNHTVAALDFFMQVRPFLVGPAPAFNQMLSFGHSESSTPLKSNQVIENWKSLFRDQLDLGELAIWERQENDKYYSSLLMGTGPSLLPAKSQDKVKLSAKCHVVGSFRLGPEFLTLRRAVGAGRNLSVLFYRPYLFLHVGNHVLEMNMSDTLTADFMYACLPFGGPCQVSQGMIFFRVGYVPHDSVSMDSVTEAKAGTLLFWFEKKTFILCTETTPLPGACSEVATMGVGFDVTVQDIRNSEEYTSNKLTLKFVSASEHMNVPM